MQHLKAIYVEEEEEANRQLHLGWKEKGKEGQEKVR
jgi:hypothetical protein